MLDINSVKVLSAWGANAILAVTAPVIPWVEKLDTFAKPIFTLSQIGVAVVTIIYIAFKIRNESRK